MIHVLFGLSLALNIMLLAIIPIYLDCCKKQILAAKKEMEEKYNERRI